MKLLFSVGIFFNLLVSLAVSQDHSLQKDGLVDTIWDGIKSATTCAGCNTVLLLLKGIAAFGDGAFVGTLTELCKISNAEDDDVCIGAIKLEGPIIAKDLRAMSIPSKTSQIFCITFLGLCPYPPVTPYTVSFPSPKPLKTRPAPSGQAPIQVVHFSDIHIDPLYQEGANYNCTKPICCRAYTTGDAPGNTQFPAGPFGNTECDVPESLEESMYAAIKRIAPNAAMSLFTGDIIDHAVWLTSKDKNIQSINAAYSKMSGLRNVYGTIGNHESSPTNAFPPASLKSDLPAFQWVYDTVAAKWATWIGAETAAVAAKTGTYSTRYPGGNLRVISLNTNFFYIQNYFLYQKVMEADPSGHLAWLVNELQAAENAGERVYMFGHMPMGGPDALRDGSNYFDQITNRYSATIAALFFGHTHTDEFQLAYSDYSKRTYSNALQASYVAPSLTPTSGHPSFRIYSVDPVTFGVLDFTTYIANITSPTYQSGPTWTKLYSAKEVYGPLVSPPPTSESELTPAFWHNVTTAFESNDAAFQAFYARKSREFSKDTCTGSCKTLEICQLRAARSQDNCAVPVPGIHFKRALEGDREVMKRGMGVITEGQCEGSVTRGILTKLAAQHGLLERALEDAQVKYKN